MLHRNQVIDQLNNLAHAVGETSNVAAPRSLEQILKKLAENVDSEDFMLAINRACIQTGPDFFM